MGGYEELMEYLNKDYETEDGEECRVARDNKCHYLDFSKTYVRSSTRGQWNSQRNTKKSTGLKTKQNCPKMFRIGRPN